MPSRNSINKPKDRLIHARKANAIGKKRSQRERAGLFAPARSSKNSTSGMPHSTALALYTGTSVSTGVMTTSTLSKKRSQKIERNKKYNAVRNQLKEKILVDLKANEEQMDLDNGETLEAELKEAKKSKLDLVKEALWSVVDDALAEGFVVASSGDGTTLGGPYF